MTKTDGINCISGRLALSLHLASEALPKGNGSDIDLRPKMLFNSPCMSGEHGSGIVTIHKGGRELKADMNENKP